MAFLDQGANSCGSQRGDGYDRQASIEALERPATDGNSPLLARARRSALLSRVVEVEILPRLVLARAIGLTKPVNGSKHQATSEHDTEALVALLLGPDDGGVEDFIAQLQACGATVASLFLGVVTGAARRLGELWEDDRCDFAQVTISVGRLQQLIRTLSPSFQMAAVRPSDHADTVLLLPVPGEQHTIGLLLLSEYFQREGWRVIGGPASGSGHALELVRDESVDIVGLSIGSVRHLDALTACIGSLRKVSRNRYLVVMVGGPLLLQRPDLVVRVGADTTAPDAPSAIRQARGLLAMRAAAD
jgi:MerR family transcriptional regulator, light-induced transcriptional regulator